MAVSAQPKEPAAAVPATNAQPQMAAPPGLAKERLDKLPLSMQTRANFNVKAVTQKTPEYQEIKEVVDGLVKALSTKDAALFKKLHVDDGSLVYYGPPAVTVKTLGSRQYAELCINCLEPFEKVDVRTNNDMDIRLSGPLAVVTLTGTNRLVPKQGKPTESKWRWTLTLENTQGQWLVGHEHFSFASAPTAVQ
ncbi:YybH family protein [Pyxidicoccus sp. MSG2]|uniref:YybH family protein n=1 Tax=Pyxidicoccus sp. MSG2 TaxID=2996790 RepID=UPI00227166C4|nr:nuclear transport factor 2 family protein [Pyxidicoccus sp. MSG2]MCY1021100.1 nuclear transport factor 2 family protein [Pyxidicoccus sp. MSG2]